METKRYSKLNIKAFVKDACSGSRLQSLRLPRDLSLGGTKLTKKTYKPNLNVVRNKDKTKEIVKTISKPKYKNNQLPNEQAKRYVQSTGGFSEGMGAVAQPVHNPVYAKERQKLQAVRQKSRSVDKAIDDTVWKNLVKHKEDSETKKETKVPFNPIEWSSKKVLDPIKKGGEFEITGLNVFLNEYTENIENSKLSLTLWQLPDSFAFKSRTNHPNVKKLIDCKLTDLPEGQIGKICVRKSGKIIIHIGSLEYELEPAEFNSFMEEVVSVNVTASQGPAVTVLGNIDNRFLLSPLWSSLLS